MPPVLLRGQGQCAVNITPCEPTSLCGEPKEILGYHRERSIHKHGVCPDRCCSNALHQRQLGNALLKLSMKQQWLDVLQLADLDYLYS